MVINARHFIVQYSLRVSNSISAINFDRAYIRGIQTTRKYKKREIFQVRTTEQELTVRTWRSRAKK